MQLHAAQEAGRFGVLSGPAVFALLRLPEDLTGAALWARAYTLRCVPLPALPEDAPDTFAAHVRALEAQAADLPDGEEKTARYDGAAVWAVLEGLARVLLAKDGGAS